MANEVKKLSQQTSMVTANISKLINEIEATSVNTYESMDDSVNTISTQSDYINNNEKDKLVLVTAPYPPFIIYNKETNKLSGIDIDIITEIFNRANMV